MKVSRQSKVAAVLGYLIVAGNRQARSSQITWSWLDFPHPQKSIATVCIPWVLMTVKSSSAAHSGFKHFSPIVWPNCIHKPKYLSGEYSKNVPFHFLSHCSVRSRIDKEKYLDTMEQKTNMTFHHAQVAFHLPTTTINTFVFARH